MRKIPLKLFGGRPCRRVIVIWNLTLSCWGCYRKIGKHVFTLLRPVISGSEEWQ